MKILERTKRLTTERRWTGGNCLVELRRLLGCPVLLACLVCGGVAFVSRGETNDAVAPTRLPPTQVYGEKRSLHDVESESELVGPAQQPEWTTRRIFAETDVYVIPPGEIEFNQFYISSHTRHEKPGNLFESELEIGLPWRTQFDVELNYAIRNGKWNYDSTMIELPHALADWGKIPLNPAVDAGWRFRTEGSDAYVARLLLAEQFGERFYFGANLSFERQTAGELETGYELNAALNYRLVDRKLSVGAQLVAEYETARDREFDTEDNEWETTPVHSTQVLLGPSLLYRPSRSVYLGLTPLFGLTRESPTVEAYFLLGIDFEPFSRAGQGGRDREDNGTLPRLQRPR
jgi:hypothetical protein